MKGVESTIATTEQQQENDDNDDDHDDDEYDDEASMPGHTRWTFNSLGVAPSTVLSPSTPLASPFDAFLQRVLLASSSSSSGSSGAGSTQASALGAAQWTSRPTAVSLDGFTFAVGGTNGLGDWEVKVTTVGVKGGASTGSSKGVVVEITYLPVPYLPPGSTFIRDFASVLFPPQALAIGEIEWYEPDYELMFEAGLIPFEEEKAEGEWWEWTDKHSAFAYLQIFRKEGML